MTMMLRIFNKYWWHHILYEQVVSRMRPRNRWFTKWVPRQWRDADYLIEQAAFRVLIFFWEEDAGEESLRYQWQHEPDSWHTPERVAKAKEVYDILLSAYEWAKIRDAEFENTLSHDDGGWAAEEKLKEIDTLHLTNIIKYRGYMWT